MTYETYSYLVALISQKSNDAHQDYLIALNHLPVGDYKDAKDAIYNTYITRVGHFNDMKKELLALCQEHHKDSSPEMKKFWLIE